MTTFNLIYEFLVDFMTYKEKDTIIESVNEYLIIKLMKLKYDINEETSTKIFWAVFLFDFFFSIILYLLGFIAVYRKSYKMMNYFSCISLIGCI